LNGSNPQPGMVRGMLTSAGTSSQRRAAFNCESSATVEPLSCGPGR
jgi:hypothetical protein